VTKSGTPEDDIMAAQYHEHSYRHGFLAWTTYSVLTGCLVLAGCSAASGASAEDYEQDAPSQQQQPPDDEGFTSSAPSNETGSDTQCAALTVEADNQVQPSDIVIAIDQSGSMKQETNWVKDQLNGFAQQITASGIDVHVVVIAGKPGSENGFCVPAPLGSGSCPNDDALPALLHVNQHVDSHDALVRIVSAYPLYQQVLRPNASKHIVVISDDDSDDMSAGKFHALVSSADPSFANYSFHAIASSSDKCPFAAEEGKEYKQLVALTGGVFGDLCLQNFQPVWDELSTQVIAGATLACSWQIPAPPDGESYATDQVNVAATVDGQTTALGYVGDAAQCANVSQGWYYDNPSQPTEILVCPTTCASLQAAQNAKVDISFGCQTELAVPR